jgi:hypothetical protein
VSDILAFDSGKQAKVLRRKTRVRRQPKRDFAFEAC